MDYIVEILKSGGTLLYPTDTIWGIGCDATNVEAIKKIFEIKDFFIRIPEVRVNWLLKKMHGRGVSTMLGIWMI